MFLTSHKAKTSITAAVGVGSVLALTLSPVVAYADVHDFVFAGTNGMTISAPPSGGYAAGQTVSIGIDVIETTVDQGGGENHPHALPPTIQFQFTPKSGSPVTVTGRLKTGGLYETDSLNQQYSGTYTVTLPTTGNTFTVTAPIIMWEPNNSTIKVGTQATTSNGFADTDDPVGGSASVTLTTTTTSGNLPEVPYAGILPLALVGGYVLYRTSKKFRLN